MAEPRTIRVPVKRCARCGGDHAAVSFAPILCPVEHEGTAIATHWAPCPENGEPILMAVRGDA